MYYYCYYYHYYYYYYYYYYYCCYRHRLAKQHGAERVERRHLCGRKGRYIWPARIYLPIRPEAGRGWRRPELDLLQAGRAGG